MRTRERSKTSHSRTSQNGTRANIRKRLSKTLRKFLRSRQLSTKHFADAIRVNERTVRNWITGRTAIDFEAIAASQLWRAFVRCFIAEERRAGL